MISEMHIFINVYANISTFQTIYYVDSSLATDTKTIGNYTVIVYSISVAIKRVDVSGSAGALAAVTQQFRALEHSLRLAGATAVQDCLQDGVADTLAALRRAGVRVWVLTGDKVHQLVDNLMPCLHISKQVKESVSK